MLEKTIVFCQLGKDFSNFFAREADKNWIFLDLRKPARTSNFSLLMF